MNVQTHEIIEAHTTVKAGREKRYDSLACDFLFSLDIGRGINKRFKVGAVPRGSEGRKVHEGPMVPGPWAYAYGIAGAICANPEHGTFGEIRRAKAAGKFFQIEDGSLSSASHSSCTAFALSAVSGLSWTQSRRDSGLTALTRH
jgi:hypothetical protein